MRNDARPVGEDADETSPIPSERPDPRRSVTDGRESNVVHPAAEENRPDGPEDPVTPSSPTSPRSKI